jgi:hypothetical protein
MVELPTMYGLITLEAFEDKSPIQTNAHMYKLPFNHNNFINHAIGNP